MTTVEAFRATLTDPEPPEGAPPPLVALWHIARGDIDKAQRALVDEETVAAAWVRAHLHRRNGDETAAAEWYDRAGKSPADDLDEDWNVIAYDLMLGR